MTGYVICASCGARIKANRERCLRCDEPLVAAAPASAPLGLPDWLTASSGRMLMAGAAASLVVLLAATIIWESRSQPAVDDVARPAPGALTASRPGVPARPGDVGTREPFTPATSLDSSRLAGAAYGSGDLASAKAHFEEAVAKNPDDPDAINGVGQILARQGQVDEAIQRFTRAIQLAPNKWTYHFNLAHAEGQLGHWDNAIAEYRTAAGLFPQDYATQYNLAMALHKKGDDQGAVGAFKRAIELAPSEPSFHLSLGISLEKTGKLVDAQREYAQYLEMEPSAPEAEKLKAHIQALASGQTATQGGQPTAPKTPQGRPN
jgi:Flp pilus assembly protein TadD